MDHTEEVDGVIRGLEVQDLSRNGSTVDDRDVDLAGPEVGFKHPGLELHTGLCLHQHGLGHRRYIEIQRVHGLTHDLDVGLYHRIRRGSYG